MESVEDAEAAEAEAYEHEVALAWLTAEEADLAVVDRVPGGGEANWKEMHRGWAFLDDTYLYAKFLVLCCWLCTSRMPIPCPPPPYQLGGVQEWGVGRGV